MNTDDLVLESLVYADSAHVTHLVLEGLTEEADAYSQQPEVAARIRRWKAKQDTERHDRAEYLRLKAKYE